MKPFPSTLVAIILALGITAAGFFVGDGIAQRDHGSSIVSVKGLSEREVAASLAIWTIGYSANADEIPELRQQLSNSTKHVVNFLISAGFTEEEISILPPSMQDLSLIRRSREEEPPAFRYTGSQSVMLRTSQIDRVKPAVAGISVLMERGVFLGSIDSPNYSYNDLNSIKPAMIEEATKNARLAGDQFARDSEVELGSLKNASQGWFNVNDRDSATPEIKVVRVVVEVEFEIE